MAVAARKLEAESYEYMPVTRVYAQPKKEAIKKPLAQAAQQGWQEEERAKARELARRDALKHALMLVAIAVASASMLLMLMRYCMITQQYAKVNTVKGEIQLCQREVQELSVQLNSMLTLRDAREAAEAAGMGYPTAEQIVKIDAGTRLQSPR